MAGIGFELKKLFQKRGLAATAKAYGYAGVICTGPMLLGIVLLVGIAFICDHTGATRHNRELLNCMITYTLLASLTVTSFFSMVVTRYIADMLYEERHEAVLFSFWGSTAILLVVGVLWSSIFVTLMANKIGGLQFGIYRNCQISSRVFHTAVAALPLTKANRSDFE